VNVIRELVPGILLMIEQIMPICANPWANDALSMEKCMTGQEK
jgi:hypothetical protein